MAHEQQRWTEVDDYVDGLLVPQDPTLDAALAASRAAGLPDIQVAPNQGMFLHLVARAVGARRILELGTLGGYSTIWLARALPPGGHLVSLEYEARHAEVARANLAAAGVDPAAVEIRVGAALDTLPTLAEAGAGPFDLVFIDADKDNYPGYLDWSMRLTRPGSVVIADNVVREGRLADPDDPDGRVRGVRRFTELVAAEPRLDATVLQTVGVKGYDGFLMALVKEAPSSASRLRSSSSNK